MQIGNDDDAAITLFVFFSEFFKANSFPSKRSTTNLLKIRLLFI